MIQPGRLPTVHQGRVGVNEGGGREISEAARTSQPEDEAPGGDVAERGAAAWADGRGGALSAPDAGARDDSPAPGSSCPLSARLAPWRARARSRAESARATREEPAQRPSQLPHLQDRAVRTRRPPRPRRTAPPSGPLRAPRAPPRALLALARRPPQRPPRRAPWTPNGRRAPHRATDGLHPPRRPGETLPGLQVYAGPLDIAGR